MRYTTICEQMFFLGGDVVDRVILHSDLNNFYASVSCLNRPELHGKPVAVCGDPEVRHGIILAKNEVAKACGVATGEPLWKARQKCPDIVFLPPDYERYRQFSKQAREIYAQYTDQVEPFGLDECWLDVTGSRRFGSGREIADTLRKRIRNELGLTVSVGVSFNKIFAKLGSDLKKPDATTVILRENFQKIVWPLPVTDLLFVGRSTAKKLFQCGIRTIGQLAQAERSFLQHLLGQNGVQLWQFANGLDDSPVANIADRAAPQSIGNSITLPRDLTNIEEVKITLHVLCQAVSTRLRKEDLVCQTVKLGIRDHTLSDYERQAPLPFPSRAEQVLFEETLRLFAAHPLAEKPVRALSVRAARLSPTTADQLSFFPEQQQQQKQEALDTAADRLRRRYGNDIIRRGIVLSDPDLSDIDPLSPHSTYPSSLSQDKTDE